jgi:hypothetical protein
MKYRPFGNLDWKASALGFGCMRFPTHNDDPAQIDQEPAADMLTYAIEHGVNYLDTAYPYHRKNSEPFVGRFVQENGYRDQVKLATKMPVWEVETNDDFDRLLDLQLSRLHTDQIDFYLLHALNEKSWTKVRDLGILSWSEKAKRDGRIAHFGFSFHDEYRVFKDIVDAFSAWDFCQIQYNYMDVHYQAGRKGLRYAASKGLAVVVMEPIRGGRLVNPPDSVREIWAEAPVQRTPADWALQWLWDQPEVSLVLSGMSEMDHVRENVASAEQAEAHSLSPEEQEIIQQVREQYEAMCVIPCTDCKYCLPCPEGVDIPRVLGLYNDTVMYDKLDYAQHVYNNFVRPEQRADLCVACRECEEKCPQEIPISEWMPKIHTRLHRA